jgi:hypothetical protein
MIYDDEFLNGLSTDPLEGIVALCERFIEIASHNNNLSISENLDALAAILAFCDSHGIECSSPALPESENQLYRVIYA